MRGACCALAAALLFNATAAHAEGWPEDVPRARWWEWVGSGVVLGSSLGLRFGVDVSGEPTWSSGILFDDALYDEVFLEDGHLFGTWRTMGDIGYLGSFAWTALDPLLAGIVYDWDTALQMTAMNLEAFSIYSMVLSLAQIAVRRERPAARECDDPAKVRDLGISCGVDNANVNRSFIGGHTGTAALAATMTCMHHANVPIYGDRGADALPCVTMWAVTAMVFTSRTITGQHYFSDNFFGVGVGMGSTLLPYFLHYGSRQEPSGATARLVTPTAAMVVPREDGFELTIGGVIH